MAVRTTSSAEYLITAIRETQAGAILALAIIAVAIAGINYGIYRSFERASLEQLSRQ